MGDSWEHRIQIEKQLGADPGVSYPRFVDGAMRCPPEDVGGIPGSMASSKRSPIPAIPITTTSSIGPFDPDNLDLDRINKELNRIATRRQRAAEKRRT
jgi:hypothetical protein